MDNRTINETPYLINKRVGLAELDPDLKEADPKTTVNTIINDWERMSLWSVVYRYLSAVVQQF